MNRKKIQLLINNVEGLIELIKLELDEPSIRIQKPFPFCGSVELNDDDLDKFKESGAIIDDIDYMEED